MTKRTWKLIGVGVIVLLLGIQLVPTAAPGNPPAETEVTVPDDVMLVLRQSCYDCHSHETQWPWYSNVAPAKWLVRHDVSEARRNLNFSAWNRYDANRRAHKWEEVVEQLESGHMPLWYYLALHADARPSDADRQILMAYARGQAEAEAASGGDEGAERGSGAAGEGNGSANPN